MVPYFLFVGISVFNITVFIFIVLNDVIHKYTHMLDSERPPCVTLLQKLWLIQGHDEHHQHHIAPHMINYCPITPYVNTILEKLNFWRRLENQIESRMGFIPRSQTDDFIEDDNYPAGIKFIKQNNE